MKLVIFGCGTIANRIAKSCKLVEGIELVGFASNSLEKAKQYAEKYECKDYGDYEHFLSNPDIDAVYVATYNLSHVETVKRCLKHHKSVICEKPMFSSLKENEELFALAKENGVTLMEAMKAVFLPLNIKVKEMMKSGVIGEITDIHASFTRGEDFADTHWIYDLKTGGALKDVGSYCAGIMNFLTDEIPVVTKLVYDRKKDRSDRTAEVWIDYGKIKGHLKASNEFDGDSNLIVTGTYGRIVVENFWKTGSGYYEVDSKRYELNEELISDFYYELEHFRNLVDNHIGESPIMSKEASDRILMITAKGDTQ